MTTPQAKPPRTIYQKIFDAHLISEEEDGTCLIYIDRHLVHEVTSPQAFEGLRLAGRPVRRTDCTLATVDHNIPTVSRDHFKNTETFVQESDSRLQCITLEQNVKEFGLTFFGLTDSRQGIVHVIGPQLGLTQPGTTVVCGDSHTATHGAFGALAFGIGTSEVEHVLATQTLSLNPFKTMAINVRGKLQPGVTAKDIILAVIAKIGTGGGQGYVLEYRGPAIEALSMEARMTVCNMSIEAGARAGMIAPDETTFDYLKGRDHAPTGADWDAAVADWRELRTDDDAECVRGDEVARGRFADMDRVGDVGQQSHRHEFGGADAEGAGGDGVQAQRQARGRGRCEGSGHGGKGD